MIWNIKKKRNRNLYTLAECGITFYLIYDMIHDRLRNNSSVRLDYIWLRNRPNQFENFISSLIHKRTFKNVCSKLKTVLRENHVNRESKSLDITIQLYICYDEHADPSSCNTTIYLSWLLHLEDILGGKFHR